MIPSAVSVPIAGDAASDTARDHYIPLGRRLALQVVADLFPPPTLGLTFAKRFIERAAVERSTVPDVQEGDAVICTRSIAELGKELDLSNDTTDKYVLLFKALGLLEKRKVPGGLAFVLHLGIYQPVATLEANLDYLITKCTAKKSRGKFHHLLINVKQRCQVQGLISQDLRSGLQQLHTLLSLDTHEGCSRRRVEQRLLQAQSLVTTLIAQVMLESSPQHARRVDSFPQTVGAYHPSTSNREEAEEQNGICESSSWNGKGRGDKEGSPRRLPILTGEVDVSPSVPRTASTQNTHAGRRHEKENARNLSDSLPWVDSERSEQQPESTQIVKKGGFGEVAQLQPLPEMVKKVDSAEFPNVNVITFIRNITLNVDLVALLCCKALGEEPSKKRGVYLHLFREVDYDAQAITAALIYVLVHQQDGTMQRPPAVFNRRCKDYHQQGVPAEVAHLVERYGALPYSKLIATLQRPKPPLTLFTPPTQKAVTVHQTPASLPPIPTYCRLTVRIPLQSGGGMAPEDARRLLRSISDDLRIRLYAKGLAALTDGTYAVLVDNTVSTKVRQVAFYSSQQWQTCSGTLRRGADLFGGENVAFDHLPTVLLQRGGRP